MPTYVPEECPDDHAGSFIGEPGHETACQGTYRRFGNQGRSTTVGLRATRPRRGWINQRSGRGQVRDPARLQSSCNRAVASWARMTSRRPSRSRDATRPPRNSPDDNENGTT